MFGIWQVLFRIIWGVENRHILRNTHRYLHQQKLRMAVCCDGEFVGIPDTKAVTAIQLLAVDGNIAAQHKNIYPVAFQFDRIIGVDTFVKTAEMEPGILMNPHTCVIECD